MLNDFCAFILSHGRPNKVVTYKTLLKHGYTGKIYIIIDNEDKTAEEYYKIYGDKVIMFDKLEIANRIDEGDIFNDRRTILYARNACFEIAEKLGIKYFIQLDDDYTDFRYKLDTDFNYIHRKEIKDLDRILEILLKYYKSIPALSIAMSQGGDYLGGHDNSFSIHRRKCMNSFICSTDRKFEFFGRINEDVNTYTRLGSVGKIFLTLPNVALQQMTTQNNKGGMSDVYLSLGTYIKSFYTVMYFPSAVTIRFIQSRHPRLHHAIEWNNTIPMILREEYKQKE